MASWDVEGVGGCCCYVGVEEEDEKHCRWMWIAFEGVFGVESQKAAR